MRQTLASIAQAIILGTSIWLAQVPLAMLGLPAYTTHGWI